MANNTTDLANRIEAGTNRSNPVSFQDKINKWFAAHASNLTSLAGSQDEAKRIFTVCLSVISRNPMLLNCRVETLFSCITQSMSFKLLPGAFQECAYVPLKNGKTQQLEANFWPMYQGMIKLALNAGNKCGMARVVYEGDHFEFREGLEAPVYIPAVVQGKERGRRRFAYAAVCTRSGMWQVEIMSPQQIDDIKGRSRGAKSSDSPWNSKYEDDVNAMWAKTVLRRVLKLCSKSPELVEAIEIDDDLSSESGVKKNAIIEIRPEYPSEPEEAPEPEQPKEIEAPPATMNIVYPTDARQTEILSEQEQEEKINRKLSELKSSSLKNRPA